MPLVLGFTTGGTHLLNLEEHCGALDSHLSMPPTSVLDLGAGNMGTFLQFSESHFDCMWLAFLHGGMWRPLSFSDCFAAAHRREIILLSFSSFPTKMDGSVLMRSVYVGVGLANSN